MEKKRSRRKVRYLNEEWKLHICSTKWATTFNKVIQSFLITLQKLYTKKTRPVIYSLNKM